MQRWGLLIFRFGLLGLFGFHCTDPAATEPDLGIPVDASALEGDMQQAVADLAAPAMDMAVPATPLGLCSSDSWCWDNPLPMGNNITEVWGADANHVWFTSNQGRFLKWNGTALVADDTGVSGGLKSIWGTSASNVWAVGIQGTIL